MVAGRPALVDGQNLGGQPRVADAHLKASAARPLERHARRAGDLQPARAGVRDVVGPVVARPAERAGRDNQVVVVVEEHGRFDEPASVEERLVDAGVEALAALGLERRVVGVRDLEGVRRRMPVPAEARTLVKFRRSRRRTTRPRPSGSPRRRCRCKRRARRECVGVAGERLARDAIDADARRDEQPRAVSSSAPHRRSLRPRASTGTSTLPVAVMNVPPARSPRQLDAGRGLEAARRASRPPAPAPSFAVRTTRNRRTGWRTRCRAASASLSALMRARPMARLTGDDISHRSLTPRETYRCRCTCRLDPIRRTRRSALVGRVRTVAAVPAPAVFRHPPAAVTDAPLVVVVFDDRSAAVRWPLKLSVVSRSVDAPQCQPTDRSRVAAVARNVSNPPPSNEADASGAPLCRVTIRTTEPMAFDPYSALCGPRTISIRSMLATGRCAKS